MNAWERGPHETLRTAPFNECYRDFSTAIVNRIVSGSSTICPLAPDENHFAILRTEEMGVDWVPFVDQRGDSA
jgi:hypothetical protein